LHYPCKSSLSSSAALLNTTLDLERLREDWPE